MNALTAVISAIVLIVGAVIPGVITLIQNVVYQDFTKQDFKKDVHKPGSVEVNVISLIGLALVIYGLPWSTPATRRGGARSLSRVWG